MPYPTPASFDKPARYVSSAQNDSPVRGRKQHFDIQNSPEKCYQEPFRIMGQLYYIGSKVNGGFLLDTGDGLIILDTGYAPAAPMLVDAIWRLGFDPKNIKMIFHTHKHSDHCGATRILKELSGAKTLMGARDVEGLAARIAREGENAVRFVPDIALHDGDTFALGNTTIRCYDTPGHSAGCMAFFFDVFDEAGNRYRAVLPGDISLNTTHKNYITQWDPYPTCWQDFLAWTERMMDWPVDITLGCHVAAHARILDKYEDMKANPSVNPFVDATEWKRTLTAVRSQLKKNIELEEAGKMWMDCSTPRQTLYVSEDVPPEMLTV